MDKTTRETMFSSKDLEWGTPQHFFHRLEDKFGTFTLDPCSTDESAKCDLYYTQQENGLAQSWEGHSVFMNPPYGRKISSWISKAYEESLKPNTRVGCLIPARTDTKYWHNYCMRAKNILFVKGRLKFGASKNSAPFPSAVIIFEKKNNNLTLIETMEGRQ